MVQTSATATGVAIIGRMKMVRSRPRNGKVAGGNTSAAAVPKPRGSTTARTVK